MNGIQLSRMEISREWPPGMLETNIPQKQVAKHQKTSQCKRPVLFTVKYELSWDIIGRLLDQEYIDNNIHFITCRVIILIRNKCFVQALLYKWYMEQIWPSTGAQFVRFLECLMEIPAQSRKCALFKLYLN